MAETSSNPLDGLEERLKNHSKAFESLLALTPAQEYYGTSIVDGRDPSEQWRAKKQSKAEKKAARKAKLDPANQKSALDVMKERERKRKRELGMDSDADEEETGDGAVETHDAEQDMSEPSKKKAKVDSEPAQLDEDKRREKAEKRKQQRERKKEKQNKLKAKKEAKLSKKQADAEATADDDAQIGAEDVTQDLDVEGLASEADEPEDPADELDADEIDIEEGLEDDNDNDNASTASSTSGHGSPAFDVSTNHSTASSSSSILPPSEPETTVRHSSSVSSKPTTSQQPHKPALSIAMPDPLPAASILKASEDNSTTSSPKPHIPKIDQAILQERLRVRIEELRAKRKADGADGQPARSRQELLEQRRKKADQRKAHKKELRRKAREEEALKQEERLRGSGSPLSGADIFSPRSESNSFSFSRLAFSDGSMADASLTKLVDAPKQKGPQDPKTALLAAENKQKRLAGLDEHKRADIGEKDMWLNASKRTHGERVRDDQSLLKKALKRKEKQKARSEKEWQEREQAVVKGKEMKQKKREDNLAKRREEKGGGGSKKKTVKKGGKKRPGFEGRFKA